jgi:acetoin utilization deacetylase AcuC-like enzyme
VKAFYTDHFVLPLPEGHRFPMRKYARLRERVAAELEVDLAEPPAATDDELLRAHARGYLSRVVEGRLGQDEVRRLGFPWSAELVERSRRSCGATLAACRQALVDGTAVNLAGGTHHAFRDRGEGYCVFNDAAVAALAMLAEGAVERVLVVDCDVHQGNGTAAILRDDPRVFTFSLHGAKNFPFRKEASDLDVELGDGAGDDAYLAALDEGLARCPRAPLAIYVAGADPYEDDRLGRLKLTKAGLEERDRRVFGAVGAVAVVMAGGYARDVEDTVDIHFRTVRLAAERARRGS